mmetsp:Transcript_124741/g.399661  ORF Transcript_124741/g.399661 Transcript_124741/m.399661 type:complete len:234 (-) Transcript_124741:10-711(-)
MCPVVLASISDSNCPAATRPRIRRASEISKADARRETSATSTLAAEAAASAAAKTGASAPGASEKPGAAGGGRKDSRNVPYCSEIAASISTAARRPSLTGKKVLRKLTKGPALASRGATASPPRKPAAVSDAVPTARLRSMVWPAALSEHATLPAAWSGQRPRPESLRREHAAVATPAAAAAQPAASAPTAAVAVILHPCCASPRCRAGRGSAEGNGAPSDMGRAMGAQRAAG